MSSAPAAPIGVFDSGVGGLTVLRALRERLPAADFVYLGDTARLPYGTKSAATVRRYAVQAATRLVDRQVGALVVACNTASAIALDTLAARWPDLPVVGVVEPGAAAACAATRTGCVAVVGTESTIRGEAYQRAIARARPGTRVLARACGVFVALAEEGWHDGPAAEAAARAYLDGWLEEVPGVAGPPDTLVLGCTHFPVLRPLLARLLGPKVTIVDSASTAAEALARRLGVPDADPETAAGALRLLATDGPERFARVGRLFLGEPIEAADVEIVDL